MKSNRIESKPILNLGTDVSSFVRARDASATHVVDVDEERVWLFRVHAFPARRRGGGRDAVGATRCEGGACLVFDDCSFRFGAALWLQFCIGYYAARREIWLITLLIVSLCCAFTMRRWRNHSSWTMSSPRVSLRRRV